MPTPVEVLQHTLSTGLPSFHNPRPLFWLARCVLLSTGELFCLCRSPQDRYVFARGAPQEAAGSVSFLTAPRANLQTWQVCSKRLSVRQNRRI